MDDSSRMVDFEIVMLADLFDLTAYLNFLRIFERSSGNVEEV